MPSKKLTRLQFLKAYLQGKPEASSALKQAQDELDKEHEEERLKKLKELDTAEKLWRSIIKKAEKSWTDKIVLHNAGIENEKDLEELMVLLRNKYKKPSVPKVLDYKTKESFIRTLIQLLDIFK